jgi:hypothetical protein
MYRTYFHRSFLLVPACRASRVPTAPLRFALRSASSKMPSKTDDKYTDPQLRNEVKEEIQAGDKGGEPGQWSARKVSFTRASVLSSTDVVNHRRR